jgi:hypothetical protein
MPLSTTAQDPRFPAMRYSPVPLMTSPEFLWRGKDIPPTHPGCHRNQSINVSSLQRATIDNICPSRPSRATTITSSHHMASIRTSLDLRHLLRHPIGMTIVMQPTSVCRLWVITESTPPPLLKTIVDGTTCRPLSRRPVALSLYPQGIHQMPAPSPLARPSPRPLPNPLPKQSEAGGSPAPGAM